MPDFILFILAIVAGISTVITFFIQFDQEPKFNPYWILFLTITIALSIWFSTYHNSLPKIKEVTILNSFTVDNIDVVNYKGNIINLNKVMNRRVDTDTNIRVTEYEDSYMTNVGVFATLNTYDTRYEIVHPTTKEDDSGS
jgi:hypothetical protein